MLSIIVNMITAPAMAYTVLRLERHVRTVKHNAICSGYMVSLLNDMFLADRCQVS